MRGTEMSTNRRTPPTCGGEGERGGMGGGRAGVSRGRARCGSGALRQPTHRQHGQAAVSASPRCVHCPTHRLACGWHALHILGVHQQLLAAAGRKDQVALLNALRSGGRAGGRPGCNCVSQLMCMRRRRRRRRQQQQHLTACYTPASVPPSRPALQHSHPPIPHSQHTTPAPAPQPPTPAHQRTFMRSPMRWMSKVTSGNSSASASARGRLRLRMVMRVHPLLCMCFTSSLLILPAPMMHTCGGQRGGGGEGKQGGKGQQQGGGRTVLRQNCFHLSHGNQHALSRAHVQPALRAPTLESLKSWVGSLSCASSAAAEETDTAPEEIEVSERTRLPAVTACLNRPLRWRPKPGEFCPTLCTCGSSRGAMGGEPGCSSRQPNIGVAAAARACHSARQPAAVLR